MSEISRGAAGSSRLFYGWVIVLACNAIACITWGVAIFNQGVFVAHYVTVLGWSPAWLSAGPVLFHLWAGVAGIAVGRTVDRYGPRWVLIAGALFVCLALAAFAYARNIWECYAAFLLLGTGFSCIHTITIGKIVARWFVATRGRAMAAATVGAGIGGAVLVPLNATIIESHGLVAGSTALSLITLAVILPCALWVIRESPEAMGLQPDGGAVTTQQVDTSSQDGDTRIWTLSEAFRTSAFWGLSICFSLGMVAQSAYLFHQMPFLQTSLGFVGAAYAVTVTTISGMAGRAAFILIGDRITPKGWIAIVFALQAISFATLAMATGREGLMAGSALFGLTMGVAVTLQPLVTAYCFGRESFGRVYGPIYMSIRIGAAFGPGIVGAALWALGGYTVAWMGLAATLVLAVALVPLTIRRPD